MSFRKWLSIVSFLAVILLVIFAWKDIAHAWSLLSSVNIWILLLVVPTQILSFYAGGEILASFLRSKGELKKTSRFDIARFSLELNFVNHILPTGGLSGVSYAAWRFKHMGVSGARVTLANVLRYMMVFLAFLIMLFISVIALAVDGQVNRLMLLFAGSLTTLIVMSTLLLVYVISSASRSRTAGRQLAKFLNSIINRFSRRKHIVKHDKLEAFFTEMHEDYLEVRKDPKQLRAPMIWAFLFLFFEVALFAIVFAALGEWVNPAALLIAYGFAGFASAFVVTPGGAGAYEAVMISFLASAGVAQGAAIAGVVLARVVLILLTIGSGYIFYQLTLLKYGKRDAPKLQQP